MGILVFGGSVAAMVLFTMAFARTDNFTVPILIQKLQPLVALILARFILKEKLKSKFYFLALAAIIGAFFLSFENLTALASLSLDQLEPILLALGSAVIWGTCTIASKYFLRRQKTLTITSIRYFFATLVLAILAVQNGEFKFFLPAIQEDLATFSLMAAVPGFLALFIYYRGLKTTPASLATLCELAFPLGAIGINWVFLGSSLSGTQLAGAAILIGSVTVLTRSPT